MSTEREDKYEIIELLLAQHAKGADIEQRGVNGYTPLHYAAHANDVKGVELLLAHGADREAKTTVDDFNTPLQEAELTGSKDAAAVLRNFRRE